MAETKRLAIEPITQLLQNGLTFAAIWADCAVLMAGTQEVRGKQVAV